MADTEAEIQEEVPARPGVKYLGFIPTLLFEVTVHVTCMYESIKNLCGPLKPGIDRVEGSAKPLARRAYRAINVNPDDVLVSADRKVDGTIQFLDGILPEFVSGLCSQAYAITVNVFTDIWNDGTWSTSRVYYNDALPVVEAYGVRSCKIALRIPLVPQLVKVVRFGAVKVNNSIITFKDFGLPLASYLPLLPVGYFDHIVRSE